ncbi:MAG: aminoglycoside phosphotransferase family protein [Thermodesulfobacteriota bacterium]
MIPIETARTVARHWGLGFNVLCSDLYLQGSPERCLCRAAFEDGAGRLFVLEQIAPSQRERKHFICRVLDQLYAGGLQQIAPYLKTPAGQSPALCEGAWWLISPFIPGTPLNRPAYIQDGSKGDSLARFLCDLSRHAKTILPDPAWPTFSLKGYILRMEQDMARHDPDVGKRIVSVLDFLKNFFLDLHDSLPSAFCHGDYHPLNIIWQNDTVAAVIDWEFCGFKPDIYDAANLVGCVGMEHPSGLTGGMVLSFLDAMRRDSSISPRSWGLFAEFVLALRFAWLAEWLRKKDKEMIDLEIVYMHLLMKNMDALKSAWRRENRC